MRNGKYQNKKSGFNVRPLVLMLAVALLIGVSIGGTIAWLTAKADPVTNTFTVGDVNITLKESPITGWTNDEPNYGTPAEGVVNAYKLIPGTSYKKDPVVAVVDVNNVVSEDCYLFVKFTETEKAGTYLTYTSLLNAENGWTQGDGDKIPSNVWYRTVLKSAAEEGKSFHLLQDDTITINATAVTKQTMAEAAKQSLTYTAYAAQKANLTVEAAWNQVKDLSVTTQGGSGDSGTTN